jgi:hypothetical protein
VVRLLTIWSKPALLMLVPLWPFVPVKAMVPGPIWLPEPTPMITFTTIYPISRRSKARAPLSVEIPESRSLVSRQSWIDGLLGAGLLAPPSSPTVGLQAADPPIEDCRSTRGRGASDSECAVADGCHPARRIGIGISQATPLFPAPVFRQAIPTPPRRQKKTDVVERPEEFRHVGLLFNEPPDSAGLLFV